MNMNGDITISLKKLKNSFKTCFLFIPCSVFNEIWHQFQETWEYAVETINCSKLYVYEIFDINIHV